MEEDNIAEHRNYLSLEEERRRLARVVRMAVQGPLLRWVSKREDVLIEVPPQAQQPVAGHTPLHPYSSTDSTRLSAISQSVAQPESEHFITPSASLPASNQFTFPPEPQKVKVCKNYVVHELEQSENAPRPLWHKTMTAMFGDHANWEEMKVYTTKGRPLCMSVPIY